MADQILIQIRADIKDIKAKLNVIGQDFSKTTRGVGKEADKLNTKFSGLKTMIAGAFTIATLYAFKRGMQEIVRVTSNLEEQTAKFGTVFRGVMDIANAAVETLTESYGMSTREARELMAGTQDMLVPMGMARDEAANLSFEIVKLATDIGSFNNLPTAQAMEKIKSALVGMYRPMRSVGVVLSAVTVEQKALNMGLAESKDEVTALDKAVAAYTMSLEMSKDAQGDFIRTSGDFANTTKILNAKIENLKATIGEDLLPVLAELYGRIGEVTKATTTWIEETQKAMDLGLIERLHERFQKSSKKYYDFLVEEQHRLIVAIETEKGAWFADNIVIRAHEEQLKLVQEEITKTIGKLKDEKDAIIDVKAETVALIEKLGDLAKLTAVPLPTIKELNQQQKEYVDKMKEAWDVTGNWLKTYDEGVDDVNERFGKFNDLLSDGVDTTYELGDAFGYAFARFIKGGKEAESMAERLFTLLLQMSVGQVPFVGPFVSGILGAPASASSPPQGARTGQIRKARSKYGEPIFGRRYREEIAKGFVNVESIASWSHQ